jgi:hypothetical protein
LVRPRRATAKVGTKTHGLAGSSTYNIWVGMCQRCYYEKSEAYELYGGRGIRIHERWRDFENFLADVGPRPSKDRSIDRIDTNGHYEPGNVRWATWAEQNKNRRPYKKPLRRPDVSVEQVAKVYAETKNMAKTAERLHISPSTVFQRLHQVGKNRKEKRKKVPLLDPETIKRIRGQK